VLLEPLQGEGGVRVPSPGYLAAVRALCTERGALLLFDEVQTGAGRTGYFLASEADGVEPDIATLAKGLGGGLPIGAILATEAVAASFGPGSHASTFGGNPLCTAAALAAMHTLLEDGLVERCRELGEYFRAELQTLAKRHRAVSQVRGRGLLIGLELAPGNTAASVVKGMLDRGFLVGSAGDAVVRFAPPLVVQMSEIDALVVALDEVLEEL